MPLTSTELREEKSAESGFTTQMDGCHVLGLSGLKLWTQDSFPQSAALL